MKIAQITSVFPPYKGGIGQVAYHYARLFYQKGEDPTVYTVDYDARESFDFKVKYLKTFLKWGKAGFCPQLFWELKKFDVIGLHYPSFGLAEVVWLWKKIFKSKTKLIIFYHHDVVGSRFLGKIFRWHKKYLMPRIIKSADLVMVSSFDYAKNSYIKNIYANAPEKFIELPFGITHNFYPAEKNLDLLNKYNIPADKKIIMNLGGLDRNHYFKGVNNLISACAKIKSDDWHLLLVGSGDLISNLKEQAKNLNIADKITFAGRARDEELPDFYRLAEVFVLPSIDKSEAFGIVLIEAMACGIPIIASNLHGVRTVVDENKTGFLVTPGDVDDLHNKIEKIISNPELRDKFSIQARKRVEENYFWDDIGDQLIKIYQSVI